ncbi:MAG: hypothetical protein ACREYC_26455, partial [Gammaproteobacteria bacterium]
ALITLLIPRYLQLKSKFAWSLSNLVALLRMNLFTYRDLWAWLDEPFGTPPPSEELPQQQVLAFASFGQQNGGLIFECLTNPSKRPENQCPST